MHFGGPGLAHHLHDLNGGGAAHDAVVDEYYFLALDLKLVGAVLQLDAKLPDLLFRLNEGTPHIVVSNDAKLER